MRITIFHAYLALSQYIPLIPNISHFISLSVSYYYTSLYLTISHYVSLYLTVSHCISLHVLISHYISLYLSVFHFVSIYLTISQSVLHDNMTWHVASLHATVLCNAKYNGVFFLDHAHEQKSSETITGWPLVGNEGMRASQHHHHETVAFSQQIKENTPLKIDMQP